MLFSYLAINRLINGTSNPDPNPVSPFLCRDVAFWWSHCVKFSSDQSWVQHFTSQITQDRSKSSKMNIKFQRATWFPNDCFNLRLSFSYEDEALRTHIRPVISPCKHPVTTVMSPVFMNNSFHRATFTFTSDWKHCFGLQTSCPSKCRYAIRISTHFTRWEIGNNGKRQTPHFCLPHPVS